MAGPLVDLRSDTVTRPTPEMRRAMAEAEVGDDGYGEDPTVRRLEEAYAARVGKDAALFVPSGTMANQLAIRVLCPPGSLVVAGRRQHVVLYENGAAARNAAVQFHLADDTDGTIASRDLEWVLDAQKYHQPRVGLVCVEQTHMPAGGVPWESSELSAVAAVATRSGVPVHMDGARLFNAEVATGVAAHEFASRMSTVMTCMSKGLCAPVGSLLAGSTDVIEAARSERKRLGGAMRQAGVIAAAGLVALESMIDRLEEDHRRAKRIAEAVVQRFPDSRLDVENLRTNIVVFEHPDPESLIDHMRANGVLCGSIAPGVCRMVTHRDVDDAGAEVAVDAIRSAPEPRSVSA